jgi:hypothetical protein
MILSVEHFPNQSTGHQRCEMTSHMIKLGMVTDQNNLLRIMWRQGKRNTDYFLKNSVVFTLPWGVFAKTQKEGILIVANRAKIKNNNNEEFRRRTLSTTRRCSNRDVSSVTIAIIAILFIIVFSTSSTYLENNTK